jgi:translation elongation factor P/translation initiation factor 5A
MQSKPLPEGIKFEFTNLTHPDTIEMRFDLNVYMGDDDLFDEPVLYRVEIAFEKENSDDYVFTTIELYDCHDINPYDHKQLENKLKERLMDILENCTLTNKVPLNLQLKNFLAEYGDNHLSSFLL